MIEVFGEHYYVDIEKAQEIISLPDNTSGETEQNVSLIKWELVKTMIDVIVTENEDVDNKLGVKGSEVLSIPFKIAFNTLLFHKIIRKL